MTDHRTGCLLCGAQLMYHYSAQPAACVYCRQSHQTTTACANGHFICDSCHSLGGLDLIGQYCIATVEPSPLAQAIHLMKSPSVKMHGPEHHFLVPAVIISAYCNTTPGLIDKREMIAMARQRAADVKGGFCGFHGTCGAAMGAGIACSVITGATPLSGDAWQLANMMTAVCLTAIATAGGPRCCKRDAFLAIRKSVEFLNDNLHANLPVEPAPVCGFSHLNRECIGDRCCFFKR